MIKKNTEWLIKAPSETAFPRIRLICFPFAGGGVSNYMRWRGDLLDEIELCAINLPGRERFFGEPCLTDYHDLLIRLVAILEEKTDCPMVFYGHSFGALTAYFTALGLNKSQPDAPVHLYLSARKPPQYEKNFEPLSTLDLSDFKHALINKYQGIPKAILDNRELLDLFLPIIKQDFKMYEQYPQIINSYPNQQALCDITSLGYSGDKTTEDDFMGWKQLTSKSHRHIQLPGVHFDILTNWKPITELINRWVCG